MRYRFFPLLFIGFFLLAAWAVMLLWNGVLAVVVDVRTVSFFQALGLLILSRLLFGGFHTGGGRRGNWKERQSRNQMWKEKWMNLSEEERSNMRAAWRKRCGKKGE